MTTLLFVRHGESAYNNLKKFTGQKDIPLTALGEKQAEVTSEFLLKNYEIDEVYSSDLSRAVATVQAVADATQKTVKTDARFREVHLGRWTDMYIADVKEKDADAYLRYRQGEAAPGGESFKQMQNRVFEGALEVAKANLEKTVVIASHGGAIRSFLMKVTETQEIKMPIVSNASVTEVFFDGENFTLGKTAQDEHLREIYSAQDAFAN